jgi:hypothetical protein
MSTFVRDVTISDYTEIEAGNSFTKTWKIENTGTCTWSSDYSLEFVSGDEMDGSSTAIGESVNPGASVEISVDMAAPEDADEYTGYWQLENSGGTLFGSKFYVLIVVPDATSTPTVTSTAISATSTTAPTSTAMLTSTTVPTTVPTATTAPTDPTEPTPAPETEPAASTDTTSGG